MFVLVFSTGTGLGVTTHKPQRKRRSRGFGSLRKKQMITHEQVKGGNFIKYEANLPADFFMPPGSASGYDSANSDSEISNDFLNSSRFSESESHYSTDLSRTSVSRSSMDTLKRIGGGVAQKNSKVKNSMNSLRIPTRDMTNASNHSLRRVFGSPAPAYLEHGHKYVDDDPDPLNTHRKSRERGAVSHNAHRSSKGSRESGNSAASTVATSTSRTMRSTAVRTFPPSFSYDVEAHHRASNTSTTRRFPNEGEFFDGVYDDIERPSAFASTVSNIGRSSGRVSRTAAAAFQRSRRRSHSRSRSTFLTSMSRSRKSSSSASGRGRDRAFSGSHVSRVSGGPRDGYA